MVATNIRLLYSKLTRDILILLAVLISNITSSLCSVELAQIPQSSFVLKE
jgi:hypothetical protein